MEHMATVFWDETLRAVRRDWAQEVILPLKSWHQLEVPQSHGLLAYMHTKIHV